MVEVYDSPRVIFRAFTRGEVCVDVVEHLTANTITMSTLGDRMAQATGRAVRGHGRRLSDRH